MTARDGSYWPIGCMLVTALATSSCAGSELSQSEIAAFISVIISSISVIISIVALVLKWKHHKKIEEMDKKLTDHHGKIEEHNTMTGTGAMNRGYDKRRRKLRMHIDEALSSLDDLADYISRDEYDEALRESLQKHKKRMDALKHKARDLYRRIAKELCVGEPETDSPDVEQKAEEDNALELLDDGQVSRESESEHDAAGEGGRGEFAPAKDLQATEGPGVCDEGRGRDSSTKEVPELAEGRRDLGQEEPKPSTEPDPAGTSDEAKDDAEP